MDRDVIVVGAGPGGATAAMALREKGIDVLMLDRQSFPRDKACGDGIPASVFEILCDFGMQKKVKQAGFYGITDLRIVSPKGLIFDGALTPGPRYGSEAHVVPRTEFDALLQQHAIEMGAEFCQAKVEGPLIEDGRVQGVKARINGSTEEIRAPLIIAADGVTSNIARTLRPNKHQDRHKAVALRAYIDDIEELPNRVEFYLYKEILPGYAWIFPNGKNSANIGLGMRLDYFRKRKGNLKDMMNVFLELPMVKKRLQAGGRLKKAISWQLFFGSQKNIQRAYDGVMLVGDAAGLINPLTGGGIHNAMMSARLAADAAQTALQRGDFSRQTLRAYDQACHEAMWASLHRSYLIQNWMLRFPFLVDFLVRRATKDGAFARTFMEKL
jgi:geranylgeranyl reductase family protein